MSGVLEVFGQFADLTAKKRELSAELSRVNGELEQLKEVMLPYFEENPGLRMTVNGYTIYLTRKYAAKLVVQEGQDREAARIVATEILSRYMPELVQEQYNANTLSAWVRRQIDEAGGLDSFIETLPPELAEAFEIKQWHDISART